MLAYRGWTVMEPDGDGGGALGQTSSTPAAVLSEVAEARGRRPFRNEPPATDGAACCHCVDDGGAVSPAMPSTDDAWCEGRRVVLLES